MSQEGWQQRLTSVVAAQIRFYRGQRGYSAQDLSDRCAALGFAIPRPVLSNLENGRRESVSVAELIVLARALDVPPLQLLVPVGRAESLELFPGASRPAWDAARWITGEISGAELDSPRGDYEPDDVELTPAERVRLSGKINPFEPVLVFRLHEDLVGDWLSQRDSKPPSSLLGDPELYREMLELYAGYSRVIERQLRGLRQDMLRHGLELPPLPEALARVDRPAESPAAHDEHPRDGTNQEG